MFTDQQKENTRVALDAEHLHFVVEHQQPWNISELPPTLSRLEVLLSEKKISWSKKINKKS